ncbi:MAG: DUF58 domain-containing protein [Planctomycetota bacterium]
MNLATGPFRPSDDVRRTAALTALEWRPRHGGGAPGARLGRAQGASIEFADRRDYTPGDDVRHIDWRAYARSDQLVVRTYREEIAPRVDVLLDVSRSLATSEEKARGALDLAALWLALARDAGFAAQLHSVGDRLSRVPDEVLDRDGLAFDSATPLDAGLEHAASLPAEGVRVLVSDFMTPAPPRTVLRRAFARASAGIALAVWHRDEALPPEGGAMRLVDAETGRTREVVVDRARRERYLARLARWREELAAEARRLAVPFVEWIVPTDLESACRERLGPLGIVAARR